MKDIILNIFMSAALSLLLAAMIGVVILEIGFALAAFFGGWATLMLGVWVDTKFSKEIGDTDVRKNV
jgi:hypothetical protein